MIVDLGINMEDPAIQAMSFANLSEAGTYTVRIDKTEMQYTMEGKYPRPWFKFVVTEGDKKDQSFIDSVNLPSAGDPKMLTKAGMLKSFCKCFGYVAVTSFNNDELVGRMGRVQVKMEKKRDTDEYVARVAAYL